MSILVLRKFTPLGFETTGSIKAKVKFLSVNLPRWGLKPVCSKVVSRSTFCVNLPRWGLKQF